MSSLTVALGVEGLTGAELAAVARGAPLELSDKVRGEVAAAAGALEQRLGAGERIYGVTTGVGAQAGMVLRPEQRAEYQLETLLAHACGVGDRLAPIPARGLWVAKVASMARARSGCSVAVVEALTTWINTGMAPVVPASGSLGASGDLVPSAHAALPLVGRGEVLRDGIVLPAAEALAAVGLSLLVLGPRDGLSLVNGTAATTAIAALAVDEAERALAVADLLVAAGVAAVGGHAAAFDPQVLRARPHPGALRSAARIRGGLVGDERPVPAGDGVLPHDPYAWRCAAQVHGSVLDSVDTLRVAVDRELSSCSDNPVLPEQSDAPMLSGGNFHGAPIGLPADAATTALATAAAISRQRTAQLLSGAHAPTALAAAGSSGIGLGPLLTTATAETLRLGAMTPASAHWLPVDAMEDHVPNSLAAAHQAYRCAEGLWNVLAIEAICVTAAAELNGASLAGAALASVARAVRSTGEAMAISARIEQIAALLAARRGTL
jgi:histidine ammonia-lyase